MLAYLVLERPRGLARHELAELLWGEDPPDRWEGVARKVVSRARAALLQAGAPRGWLSSTGGLLGLDLDGKAVLEVDVESAMQLVEEAERLADAGQHRAVAAPVATALRLLAQPLLATADGPWVGEWRGRLESYARRARHAAASAALADGRATEAASLAQAALDRDPFDEQAARLLMAAFETAGSRASALAVYERLRLALDEQLGVRPSAESEQIYVALLGSAPGVVEREPGPEPPGMGVAPFVGRKDELAALRREWAATGPTSRVVLIEGEAGIGKTRLGQVLADLARAQGAVVLSGRCDPDVSVAHAPLVDLLGQLLRYRPDVLSRLGSLAAHLGPVVPELVRAAAPPLSPDQARERLFRAVAAAMTAVAERPVLVLVDDLHWADGDTLALLEHLVPRLTDRPVMTVLVLREATGATARTLEQIGRSSSLCTVRLSGLSPDEVAELIERSGVTLTAGASPASVAPTLTGRTAGNPLYVTQILREALGSDAPFDPGVVPAVLADVLARRVASLDPEVATTLVTAAVAGPEFELQTLEACTPTDPDRLLDEVEALCRLRWLEERGIERFGFVHELGREAVLGSVGVTRRARLHGRVADALAKQGADPGLIAHHYVSAGSVDAATGWLLAAGEAALERAAWSVAADDFRTAAEMAPSIAQRVSALVGLGRALRAQGAPSDARATIEEALTVATASGLARQAAAAVLALVGGGGRGVAVDLADPDRASLLRRALAGLSDADSDLLVPVLSELALSLVLTDATDERVALCARCLEVARESGEPSELATALQARRVALMGPTGTLARAADGREAVALTTVAVAPEARLAARLGQVEDLLELGDRAGADAALAIATDEAASLSHPYWSWAVTSWRALMAIIDGRLADAEQLAFEAVAHQGDHPEAVAALGVNLVDVRLFQGRPEEMVGLLADAADANPQIPCYRAVLALCCSESGDHAGARRAYTQLHPFALPEDSNWLLAAAVLADTCATLGDANGASLLTTALQPWADRQVILNCYGGGGAYWGPVAHHLGRLALVTGDRTAAQALLTRAVDLADGFGAPLFAERSRRVLASII